MLPEKMLLQEKMVGGVRGKEVVEKREEREVRNLEKLSLVIGLVAEPSLPPPDLPLTNRRKSGGNATKDFFTSFYHKKKNKLLT
jgi:hypothetical protein